MEGNARTWFTPKHKAKPKTPTACCHSIFSAERISRISLNGHLNRIALRLNQRPRKTWLVLRPAPTQRCVLCRTQIDFTRNVCFWQIMLPVSLT